MPQPTSSLATLRPDLASMEEFNLRMDREGFIGLRVFPVSEVAKQSGKFGKIPVEQLLKSPETARAPGSGYNRGNWKFEADSFATEEHGHEEPVDDRESELYNEYVEAEMVSSEIAQDIVLRAFEERIAAATFDFATFGSTAVTNEWDDAASATPIDDVEAQVQAIWNATGLWPNALIMNRLVYRNLRRCDQVVEAIAAQGAGNRTLATDITPQLLSEVFDLPMILVAGSAKNAANDGAALNIDPIWSGEYVAVARLCTTSNFKEPGFGRTFHWGADGSRIGATVETYRDETVRSNIVRARMDTDEKILYSGCIKLLSNITT